MEAEKLYAIEAIVPTPLVMTVDVSITMCKSSSLWDSLASYIVLTKVSGTYSLRLMGSSNLTDHTTVFSHEVLVQSHGA